LQGSFRILPEPSKKLCFHSDEEKASLEELAESLVTDKDIGMIDINVSETSVIGSLERQLSSQLPCPYEQYLKRDTCHFGTQ